MPLVPIELLRTLVRLVEERSYTRAGRRPADDPAAAIADAVFEALAPKVGSRERSGSAEPAAA